ncbi:hypothetical protein SLEP1_g16454 [Rubroshorea leprosula]|uniref:Uncharacterized protein n=1 Tax=Rubroshorea leprosula TaxID=152421 RepID=A0AAV5IYI6_9ROSI|nr:hypothetical protein SLEP1_g16454 [Rubroshorea leprosula]
MDSGGSACGCLDSSNKLLENSGDVCTMEAIKDVLQPPTPDTDREIGDFPYDCKSPITAVSKPLKVHCFDDGDLSRDLFASIDNGSPKTPKDGVFDPFAPGPDGMVLAPLCKKYIDEVRTSVARRLNFDFPLKRIRFGSGTTSMEVESISDEEMIESFYENILETVLTNQAEDLFAEIAKVEGNYDGCKTPHSAPRLNGFAETCPGAPIKPSGKARNIDLGLCRKLEF